MRLISLDFDEALYGAKAVPTLVRPCTRSDITTNDNADGSFT
jgi:hypothetical protein